MASAKWSPLDPNDIRDYFFDWGSASLPAAERFLDDDVDIVSSVISTDAAELTLLVQDFDTKRTRFRVTSSGAVVGQSYPVNNLITVSTGEQFESTKQLPVKERTT